MRLPNVENAVVDERKVTQYLLSSSHPAGAAKAAFFNRFGFRRDSWTTLRDALLLHARNNDVVTTEATPFGAAYVIHGSLLSPDGRNPQVKVAWFISETESTPHLVTAYPSRDHTP